MLSQPDRIPRATYRFQLNAEFPFTAAARLVPYLKQLGISDIYASPIMQASTGSSHGYDVNDFSLDDQTDQQCKWYKKEKEKRYYS